MSESNPRASRAGVAATLGLALACGLFLVGCNHQAPTAELEAKVASLEAKVAALESELQAHERAIAMTASATAARGSIFDSPLKRFFDAPEFWEIVVFDQGACLANCQRQFEKELEECEEGDSECEKEAVDLLLECHEKQCGLSPTGPNPVIQ